MATYQVYKFKELKEKFDSETSYNEDVIKFFDTFTFEIVANNLKNKNNSANIFSDIIKDNSTKTKIIGLLNKLHTSNLSNIIKSIRLIVFQTEEELNDLVQQCIQKIKRDNAEVRPLVARLCFDISTTYFVTKNNTNQDDKDGGKIFFRKILLTEVKKDYSNSVNYDSEEWTRERGEKSMILIGTLYNGKVIEANIMNGIIKDFRKIIEFKENQPQEYYDRLEKAVVLLASLVNCVVLNEESKKIYNDLDVYLENQLALYEENKQYISKKTRILVSKSIIDVLRKN
jgi:hypothetical protein